MSGTLSQEKLKEVWNAVKRDKQGAKALKIIRSAGLELDVPVEHQTWSGMLASIPFLAHRRGRSRHLPVPKGVRPVIWFLREIARALAEQFTRVEAYDKREHRISIISADRGETVRKCNEAADFLQSISKQRWVVTAHNPYQNTIATIRAKVELRTGQTHDSVLINLIDAVFRAAGYEGFDMELDAFKQLEINEKNTRKASRRKLLGPQYEI